MVTVGAAGVPASMRERFDLKACEIFFRRSLQTPPVRALYRSAADAAAAGRRVRRADARGDALTAASTWRATATCAARIIARATRLDSLLASMQPAVEDPAVVIAVTTTIAGPRAGATKAARPERVGSLLQRLSGLRELLGRGGRRRLRLAPDGLPGFTLWRRDVVLETGGFAPDLARGTGRPDAARASAAASVEEAVSDRAHRQSRWAPPRTSQHSTRCSPSMSDARTP